MRRILLLLLAFIVFLPAPILAQDPLFSTFPDWRRGRTLGTREVVLGDLDHDGDLDLVCANLEGPLTLYWNDGTTISDAPTWTVDVSAWTVVLGDVNGDGWLDVVVGKRKSKKNDGKKTVYWGGDGSFGTGTTFGEENATASLALGDLDNDGDLDLVCGNDGSPNTMYENVDGMFLDIPAWRSSGTDSTSRSVALGYVNADSLLDLVVGNDNEPNTLYLNTGGSFGPGIPFGPPRPRTQSVALGDMDGDGDLDLVCGNKNNNRNSLYHNDNGLFVLRQEFGPGSETQSVALGDVDADGDLDVICGNTDQEATLYLGEADSLRVNPGWVSDLPNDPSYSVVLGDMDGDGDLDLVCGNEGVNNTLYKNQLPPFPSLPKLWSISQNTYDVSLGDVDQDGDLDVAFANMGSNRVYFYEDGGYDTVPWVSSPAGTSRAVAWGDVDNDGDLDLVFGNVGSNALYLNDNGVLRVNPDWMSGPKYVTSSIALGDVNRDGRLDLVCGNSGVILPGSVLDGFDAPDFVYYNIGDVFETAPGDTIEAGVTWDIALGDVDGDGWPDIAVGNNEHNKLYRNIGGNFSGAVWASDALSRTRSIALVDLNGDRWLDLLAGNELSSNSIYLNTANLGMPGFPGLPTAEFGANRQTLGVATGDIDRDGTPDFAFGNFAEANSVYLENPDRAAWESGDIRRTARVRLGDVDADGDLDLVAGNGQQAGDFSAWYPGLANPVFRGDFLAPTHHVPNNGTIFRNVRIDTTLGDINSRDITFASSDAEGDPFWLVVEYHYSGDPQDQWKRAAITGAASPLATSPTGVEHTVVWDLFVGSPDFLGDFDDRDVTLRLRAGTVPRKVSTVRHVSGYSLGIGPAAPHLARIAFSPEAAFLPSVAVFDTSTLVAKVYNTGSADLQILDLNIQSAPDLSHFWYEPAAPFVIAPGDSQMVTFFWVPLDESSNLVYVDFVTNAFNEGVEGVMALRAFPRRVDFVVAAPDEVPQGDPMTVFLTMADSVRADSVFINFRRGGRVRAEKSAMVIDAEGTNQQWTGMIPGDLVTGEGLVLRPEVFRGTASFEKGDVHVRVRVSDQVIRERQPSGDYTMLSFPLELEGSLVDILRDDLGSGGADWVAYTYDPDSASYLGLDEILEVEPGRSYWVVARKGGALDIAPRKGLSTPLDSAFVLNLRPGWNQIANPFAFPVSWDSIRVHSGFPPGDTAVSRPVRWVPESGNSGDYVHDVAVLEPFAGYWIRNNDSISVSLSIVPAPVIATSPALLAPAADDETGWRIRLGAVSKAPLPFSSDRRQITVRDHSSYAGVALNASLYLDRWDRFDPPMNPGPSVSVYFPGHQGNGVFLDRDIRARNSSSGHIWGFDVAKNFSVEGSGDVVTLNVLEMDGVPQEARILLHDRDLNRTIDLREQTSYEFFSAKRGYVTAENARFELLVGDDAFIESWETLQTPPRQTRLLPAYPNPFRFSSVIRYELADPEAVRIRVFDVRGRLVKTIRQDHPAPGRFEVAWYGDTDIGRKAPPGVYFYRLETSRYTATRKLIRLQ